MDVREITGGERIRIRLERERKEERERERRKKKEEGEGIWAGQRPEAGGGRQRAGRPASGVVAARGPGWRKGEDGNGVVVTCCGWWSWKWWWWMMR